MMQSNQIVVDFLVVDEIHVWRSYVQSGASRGGQKVDFSKRSQKYFSRRGKKLQNFILPTRN